MLTYPAQITTYLTPADGDAALAALLALINSAKERVRVLMYGFDHPQLVDALAAAHTRGVDVQLVLDHTQACGPSEVAALHRLLLTLPAANIRIGTSPVDHQILHIKAVVVDGLNVASGSLNWSPSAFKQINSLDICSSADAAAGIEALFDSTWAWISANEPAYQPAAATQ